MCIKAEAQPGHNLNSLVLQSACVLSFKPIHVYGVRTARKGPLFLTTQWSGWVVCDPVLTTLRNQILSFSPELVNGSHDLVSLLFVVNSVSHSFLKCTPSDMDSGDRIIFIYHFRRVREKIKQLFVSPIGWSQG